MSYNRYFSQLFAALICIRRRSRFRVLFLFLLILNLFLLFILFIYKRYFSCLRSEVVLAVSLICKHYVEGRALGNLCYDLCVSEVLKPTDCQPHHFGKDVVFKALWEEKKVLLKGSMMDENQYDPVYWTDENGSTVYPDVKTFYQMICDTVSRNLNSSCNSNDNILTKLWTTNISDISALSTDMQHIVMNNIWHLLQQTEYLFSKCLEDQNIFPKVVGSCGYIYAVEYIQPLQNFMSVLYPTWQEDFYKRTEIAKLLIDYVKILDSDHMHTALGKIHLCDVKIGHFGYSDDNKVKLLDVDMVFYESVLLNNIKITEKCAYDHDCSFIDCKGACNFTTGQCSLIVQDNNLQRVCRNIFFGHILNHFGLLSSPPVDIASKLQDILQRCIAGNEKNNIIQQLYNLLDRRISTSH